MSPEAGSSPIPGSDPSSPWIGIVVDSWNSYIRAVGPLYQEFDRIGTGIDRISGDIEGGGVPKETIKHDLEH